MKPLKMINDYKCKINLTDYDYACLMIDINPLSIIGQLQEQIDKSDIDDKHGLELEQHVTVLYGIETTTSLSKILNYIPSNIGKLEFGELGIFENDDYDVLKISVIPSKELLKLRESLIKNLDVTITYPNYNPHVTIGYLKRGAGKKYLSKFKDNDFSRENLRFKRYNYSSRNQDETFIIE